MTCVMALLVSASSKFSASLNKIPVPYRLHMGSWLGIGTSTMDGVKGILDFHVHNWGVLSCEW